MSTDDKDPKKLNENENSVVIEEAAATIKSKQELLRTRNPEVRYKQTKRWRVSTLYHNVIIVDSWRIHMIDQIEADVEAFGRKMNPAWRKMVHSIHTAYINTVNWVSHPFIWIGEQFNGTYDLRFALKAIEAAEAAVVKEAKKL